MRRARRARARVPFARFTSALQPLMHRLSPGALLAAYPNGRAGFLQVLLTGRKGGWRELEFGLPDTDWSRASFDDAVQALQDHASEWMVEHTPGNPDVPRFLRVWIDGDEADVQQRASDMLYCAADVLGFPADQTYNIDFRGGDHPDFLRSLADQFEQNPRMPRLMRRFAPIFRREADELERGMNDAQ